MARFAIGLSVFLCIAAFVLSDSGALQFEKRTFGQTELSERVIFVPVFYGYRLQAYLEQRVSTAQEWVRYTSRALRKPA